MGHLHRHYHSHSGSSYCSAFTTFFPQLLKNLSYTYNSTSFEDGIIVTSITCGAAKRENIVDRLSKWKQSICTFSFVFNLFDGYWNKRNNIIRASHFIYNRYVKVKHNICLFLFGFIFYKQYIDFEHSRRKIGGCS